MSYVEPKSAYLRPAVYDIPEYDAVVRIMLDDVILCLEPAYREKVMIGALQDITQKKEDEFANRLLSQRLRQTTGQLAEHLAEQGHAAHGEAAGAIELILQFAVFEVLEVARTL